MTKKLLLFAAIICSWAMSAHAAMFEATPFPLQENSQNVKITFHADQSGVAALQGLNSDLYAHIGVWTEAGDWKHVKGAWSDNTADKLFKRVSDNTFELTIGDIRTYFGMTDATETVQKICVIARNAAGSAQTKDYFIEVAPAGYSLALNTNPENLIFMQNTSVTFTAGATQASDIKFYLNNSVVKQASNATSLEYVATFNTPGNYEVKCVASNGSETKEIVKKVTYLSTSTAQTYPGGTPKQGAVKNSDGTVTFCIAAPGKSSATIVGSWDNYMPTAASTMHYHDYNGYRYFWVTVPGLDNTSYYPYYYIIDGKYKVSDPYAHLVLDCNSDKWLKDANVFPDRPQYPYEIIDDAMMAVYKGNLDDYNWQVTNFRVEDPKSLTIYELLLRDFTGTDSSADGTVRAAIEKIPYLKKLGVTAVELLPIMQFDGNNSWGYNTNNYMAPDKSYGSPNDYKEFIDKCHQAGIAVILDIVFNHTPGLHPWFQMYEAGTSPFYNAKCPHDYGVYEDIKQEYPLWEKHWEDVLTYWLTAYKVDGFRFDLVKGLGDSNSYGSGTENYNQSRINRMAKLHAAMLKVNPYAIHINEHLAGAQEETPMGNDGQLLWNNQNYNSTKFAQGNTGGDMKYCYSSNCGRPSLSTVDYMESHDEERIGYAQTSAGGNTVTNIKGSVERRMQRLGSAAAQFLMFPGPKMIWQFGEVGYDKSITTGGGRTDAKPLGWSMLDNQYRAGLHQNYTNLCHLRKDNPELFGAGAPTPVVSGFGSDVTNARSIRLTKGDKEIILLVNPATATGGSKGVTVTTTKLNTSNYQVIAASKGFEPVVNGAGTSINVTVPNNCFCVLATKSVAGVEDVIADEIGGSNATVIGGQGEIIINGDYNNVEVYNMAGMRMGSLNVASGLYIVNVDGNVTKVVVR